MTVNQVEEYYVYMSGLTITESQKKEIKDYLLEENHTNYEFQDNDTEIVIDDVNSEQEGEEIEYRINKILNN